VGEIQFLCKDGGFEPLGRRIACALQAGRKSKVTSLAACHVTIYDDRRRPNTNMDSRNIFLKPFKKLKHRFKRGSRKRDGGSGSENIREERETDVEGSEASRRNSNLHPEVEGAVESGPSREGNDGDGRKVEQVDPPTSTPSISCDREPESM